VGISLKPEHLKRYKDLAVLLFKYRRGDLARHAGLSDLLPEAPDREQTAPEARELAADVQKLGTTSIKLGQLLSTRPDIIPPAYAESLAELQDHVEPIEFGKIEKIIEEELGLQLGQAFLVFDREPLAAGSVAQVHYAVLPDGREVAVKVQRPGIREQVGADLDALGQVASVLQRRSEAGRSIDFEGLFGEFRKSLLRELDFRLEALHMRAIGGNLAHIEEIIVPQPVGSHSSARVLTMEFIPGKKVTELTRIERDRVDGERLADGLFRAYLKQMLRDGLFHADPHPGNVFLFCGRIALIDLGMVARLTPGLQDNLLQLLLAVADNRADDAARTLLVIGRCNEDTDRAGFGRAVGDVIGQHQEVSLDRPQVGRAVLLLLKAAAEHGVTLPPELAMIGKTLLNLDAIGRILAPRFDTNAAIRRHSAEITEEQVKRDLSLTSIFSAVVDLKNFITHLPGRVNRILDLLADNRFSVKVDAIDEATLMEGMQKVANRITLGLVVAALIIGAALLMRIETRFTIFGYPGLAIVLFLFAAAGGIALSASIVMQDIRSRRMKALKR
jgi:predicted unusual protein kinase regulating ubiquinone biosynthesis (AarF/ABC1/UbiB family)